VSQTPTKKIEDAQQQFLEIWCSIFAKVIGLCPLVKTFGFGG
jgi:hypothetical protein